MNLIYYICRDNVCLPTGDIYGDHLARPLVVGALIVIAKRGAQPQTPAKLSGANCAGALLVIWLACGVGLGRLG
jgi:hypothetical protein